MTRASQVELVVKNPPALQEMWFPSLDREDPLRGNGYPLQYSCLKNPWAEEPGRLQSLGHKESDMTKANEHEIYDNGKLL